MATASTSTPDLSITSLPGATGIPASQTTNLFTVGQTIRTPQDPNNPTTLPIASSVGVNSPVVNNPTQIAYLTLASTTLTAYAVPGTTGLAVLDPAAGGETLTFRQPGVTLTGAASGEVVSLGFDGLVQSTTTAGYSDGNGAVLTSSVALPTGPGPVLINSTMAGTAGIDSTSRAGLTIMSSGGGGGMTMTTTTEAGGASGTAGSGEASASSSPSDSATDAAAGVSAGKAMVVLGLGVLVAGFFGVGL